MCNRILFSEAYEEATGWINYNIDSDSPEYLGRKNGYVREEGQIFERNTGVIRKINWFLEDNDLEKDLAVAKSRFKNANFKILKAIETHSDIIPDEVYYVDDRLGLEIVYGSTKNEVEGIAWIQPAQTKDQERTPTSLGD